jgi:hypothetical protein
MAAQDNVAHQDYYQFMKTVYIDAPGRRGSYSISCTAAKQLHATKIKRAST